MATPVKETSITCFCCLSAGQTRSFKLSGKKCNEVGLVDVLKQLLVQSTVEELVNVQAPICRGCFNFLEKLKTFTTMISENSDRFISKENMQQTRTKRMINSPHKPAETKKKSKKMLVIPIEERSDTYIENSKPQPITSHKHDDHDNYNNASRIESQNIPVNEHNYSSGSKIKEKIDRTMDINNSCKSEDNNIPLQNLLRCVFNNDMSGLVNLLLTNKAMKELIQKAFLQDIDRECSLLETRNIALTSILYKWRSIPLLHASDDKFINDLAQEIRDRVPFLFNVLCTVVEKKHLVSNNDGKIFIDKIAPIVSAYSILMKGRCEQLSAWHRLTTLVAIRGHIEDRALTRFNKLGITLSTTSKGRLLDEAASNAETQIIKEIKMNPLVKITGDNLDIYVRAGQQSTENHHKDLHLFASNLIFSRIAKPDLDNRNPKLLLENLKPEKFIIHDSYKDKLINSYCVLVGRILSDMPAFKWMKKFLPTHIKHPYMRQMEEKSKVFPLPIMMKNESKHEDCVDIMDTYQDKMSSIFEKATGSTDSMSKFKIVIGGDQLTKVNLQEVKNLRTLAPTNRKKLIDLQPVICELWHLKQDFLEKAYKELFQPSSLRQPCTLYHFKAKLQRSDVNGKVKSRFKPHNQLLQCVGKSMIKEQALEYFGMEGQDCEPTRNVAENSTSSEMFHMLESFLKHYHYGQFELSPITESEIQNKIVYQYVGKSSDGRILVRPVVEISSPPEYKNAKKDDDQLFNYCSNLCHWALHLMALDDTAKEGDITRIIPNLMHAIPFFFSHSRLSKYFIECIDYILKVEHLLSPLNRLRVLEGSFCNLRGGLGNNVESDLVQEHSVRNQKTLIKQLGANKTEKAIIRCTGAADITTDIIDNMDSALGIREQSSRHSKIFCEKDVKEIEQTLRKERPFHYTSGRKCFGFDNIKSKPFDKINIKDLNERIKWTYTRLSWGNTVSQESCGDSDDDEGDAEDDDVNILPDL